MYYWKWIFIALLLFGNGLVLGFTFGLNMPAAVAGFLTENLTTLEQRAATLEPLQISTMAIIFVNNCMALLLSFVLSPILCLAPIIVLTINGWLLAYISTVAIEEVSLAFALAGLLPHGIFELTAFIMGEALALSFGVTVMLVICKEDKKYRLLSGLKRNGKYMGLAVALLLLAAIIETYLTPLMLVGVIQ